ILSNPPESEAGTGEPYRYDPTVGLDSIGSDPWTAAVLEAGEHNGDDARSLCFTSDALAEDWELTGEASVVVPVWGSVPGLSNVAKLCEVQPGGRSQLVTLGWSPDPVTTADTIRQVAIPLRATAYVLRRGHHLRLSLALADFPRLWPTPQPAEIRL